MSLLDSVSIEQQSVSQEDTQETSFSFLSLQTSNPESVEEQSQFSLPETEKPTNELHSQHRLSAETKDRGLFFLFFSCFWKVILMISKERFVMEEEEIEIKT